MVWTEVDLSTVTLFDHTVYEGGHITMPLNGTGDFMIPGLVLDPAKYYVFKVTYSTDASFFESVFRGLNLYSVPSQGVDTGDPESSSFWEFHFEPWSANTTEATSTILIGPGRDQWEDAASSTPPEMQLLFEFSVGAADSTGGHAWVSAVSYQEAPTSLWTEAPIWAWQGSLRESGTRSSGQGVESFRTDWTAAFNRVYAAPPSDQYSPPDGAGLYSPNDGTYANWFANWAITPVDPDVKGQGILPDTVVDESGNFLDPNVLDVEWDLDVPAGQQRIRILLYGPGFDAATFGGQHVPVGDSTYVKVGARNAVYDPGLNPLPAATIAAKETLVTIPRDASEVIVYSDVELSNITLTLIDQYTQSQAVPPQPSPGTPFDYSLTFDVIIEANFAPQYRLIYADDPIVTGTTHVPPLRLFPRSDGRGASSAARVWPRPPTAGYGRVGPGSLA